MSFAKENPILVGCLGVLGVLAVLSCSGVVATWIFADKIVDKAGEKLKEMSHEAGTATGIRDPISTVPELMKSGWSLGMNVRQGAPVEYTLTPMDGRPVDCDLLRATLFPHLLGNQETIVVLSSNKSEPGLAGAVITTTVRCEWTGFPGRDGGAGAATAVVPAPPVGQEPAAAPEAAAAPDAAAPVDVPVPAEPSATPEAPATP